MNNKGFTFVETLIYVLLISGMMVTFINFVISIRDIRNKVHVEQEVQSDARRAINLISMTIKSAKLINVASSTFSINPGVLSLSMNEPTENPTIIDLDSNNILQIKKGNNLAIPMIGNNLKVSNLVFTDLTGDNLRGNVKIEITVEYVSKNFLYYQYSTDLETAISLRQ